MSFGFSVGDFIAVISFAVKAYSTLHDKNGAAGDYQSLILVQRTVRQRLIEGEAEATSSCLRPAVKNAVRHHMDLCFARLDKVDEVLKPFAASLSTAAGTGRWYKDSYMKLKWKTIQEEIESLRAVLMEQLLAINYMIQMHTAALVKENNDILKQHAAATIPSNVGNGIGFASDYKPISFIDATDSRIQIPYEWLTTWDDLHQCMIRQFKGLDDLEYIQNREYSILDEQNDGMTICGHHWEASIKPGMLLSMAVRVMRATYFEPKSVRNQCPACDSDCLRSKEHNGRIKCRFCGTSFSCLGELSLVIAPRRITKIRPNVLRKANGAALTHQFRRVDVTYLYVPQLEGLSEYVSTSRHAHLNLNFLIATDLNDPPE